MVSRRLCTDCFFRTQFVPRRTPHFWSLDLLEIELSMLTNTCQCVGHPAHRYKLIDAAPRMAVRRARSWLPCIKRGSASDEQCEELFSMFCVQILRFCAHLVVTRVLSDNADFAVFADSLLYMLAHVNAQQDAGSQK
jgi:hypothetical protein